MRSRAVGLRCGGDGNDGAAVVVLLREVSGADAHGSRGNLCGLRCQRCGYGFHRMSEVPIPTEPIILLVMLEMKVVACLLWGYRHQNSLLKRRKEKKRAVGCRLWYSATGQSTKNQTGKWGSFIDNNASSI